eukprot:CAMPEP_0202712972 /NCGR_PEP_ID=MMETSP1385-20130828/47596_1 /ASSEMBLY_ACC=CAM_ASM_000861 /TAXON_ID=933848 /ORGANISM="Elphidium margaritaceum" /LENGTH=650 /DNA_ID=CAMNT_0049373175 /DNA_START=22 /DNA_END=1974 /DNA_ORIENTATION=-
MSDTEELRQRAEAFNHQLLTSEDQYVNELETIVYYIVQPLEKAAVRCKIPGGPQEVQRVFKYLTSMLQFHSTFLSVIRDAISVIPDLYKYINFVQMYDDYIRDYDAIVDVFGSWRSMEFREFVIMRIKNKNVSGSIIDQIHLLPWYLYRPFDRIKEYYRFLKDIEKVTEKGQADYNLALKTVAKLRPVYKKIKHNEDRFQRKTRLLEVQLQIHGYNKPLVEENRFFVYNRQCQMRRRGLTASKNKVIQIYLFSDLLIWVSARGKFKGSYSFYSHDLEIAVPDASKAGDALFLIGLAAEKNKRVVECADDFQRDKLMSTIEKTYRACQERYTERLKNGQANSSEIARVNDKIRGDNMTAMATNGVELSASSLDTRTFNNIEYSLSDANGDRTADVVADSRSPLKKSGGGGGGGGYARAIPSSSFPQQTTQAGQVHDASSAVPVMKTPPVPTVNAASSISVDQYHQFPNANTSITPEPSMDHVELDDQKYDTKEADAEVDGKQRGKKTHGSRRQQIKELREQLQEARNELKVKDDRIRDLSESNKAIRQTLILRDNKINLLQDEIQHLRMKMQSHNARTKSYTSVLRQRAASFSLGKDGKITRTQIFKYNGGVKNGATNSLHTPDDGLQRAQSDNSVISVEHRKLHLSVENT